ncbi:LPS export ABC transporter ATP-binding protein [Halodesulfovibrio sp. MK-HDV]|uniref:LPS export ABC transporter ATP-binding protein n=1 Tax=Halodesulfovibrio sp. MK-HDV TaxID=2599925 RepID=UPI00136E0014|nr:LPS export ABC transporter ATP-binding protein [Halodesulfovibrio sp. MK-HDV]KAF1077812.1 Lipopolysaccharide export system ATP-binding protein LptB [Halodesulfovibrio sp. MK-HDV]
MSIIQAEGLCKIYGKREVVRNINLQMQQGEIVGLLGPNGAGKTTTFYMLIGIVKPNAGVVRVDDMEVTDWPLHERARIGLSYLPQESSVFKKLTVSQNLQLILEQTALSRDDQKKREEELMEEFGITHIRDTHAMHISGGERRRLEIARALIRDPKFILLDEPFAGIDPLAVDDIQDIIRKLRDKGMGVLISDHNVRETLKICDRANLVYEGQIILSGTPQEIVENPKARSVYLGEDFSL